MTVRFCDWPPGSSFVTLPLILKLCGNVPAFVTTNVTAPWGTNRFVAESRLALGPRLLAPDRAYVAGTGGERSFERRHVELEVVGHHADRGARVDRRALEESVRPLDHELVGLREALARHEGRPRVA